MPPGSHSAGLWTDDHNLDPPSPPYSPVAISPESVLTPESLPDSGSTHSDDLLWSSNASFVYESSLVDVSLGRRVWGLRQPVYGFNGIVQGAIKLSSNCTHVVRVEVSLLGRIKVTTSDRGLISEVVNRNLVSSGVVLSCPPRGEFTPTEKCFPFSIPFPSYVNGGTSPLPPSYASLAPTFSSEVEYCLRVDVHRKGLRRHELRVLPIMYLPKTWPSHPIPSRESAFGLRPNQTIYETVLLPPIWPNSVPIKAKATLSYPSGVTYASGHSIPLKLTIQSLEAPALAEFLLRGLEAQLVKRMVAWSSNGQLFGGREVILSKGNFIETDATQEGLAVLYFELALGESGKEQSWGIAKVVEVSYLIQVTVRGPESALNFVPTYKHVSRIGVASEPWGTRDRGLLGFGGFSYPAIGMADARLERRPSSNVAW
ncbi:hypothetical protein BJV74DRAFT_768046 [Russula compacta]|nr:hypothetical protein BJV74DRAFT_768046 [Russula compacta]